MKVQIFGSEGYIGKNFTKYLNDLNTVQLELFDVHENLSSMTSYTQIDIADKM